METPAPSSLFAGRYELVPPAAPLGPVEALDRTPWVRCWACNSTENEAEERFCINCGADLTGRRYSGLLTASDAPTGIALIPQLAASARATLPPVWDQVTDAGHTLTLMSDPSHTALTLPLDELVALQVGVGVAQLLQSLHESGLALGDLAPGDLALSATGAPRLLSTPGLHRLPDDPEGRGADIQADLRALAVLLESLTAIPRTTRRLADDATLDMSEVPPGEPVLSGVLRGIRTGAYTAAAGLATTFQDLVDDRTRPVALRPRIGATSNTGVVRDHNEDSMLALELSLNNSSIPRTWGMYIVADGMGGHAAGEVASGLAIRGAAEVVLSEYLASVVDMNASFDEAKAKEIVRQAVLQANAYVIREAQARGNDMGTTLTMALVVGDRAVIGNVGDSRTYFFRDGQLRRISKDHSLVMRLVELGQIAEDDIYTHPQRNAVLRSLGDKPELEVDLFSQRLRPGDALFLCSDGQWEMTRNPDMSRIISEHDDPQRACNALIVAANKAGGEDNITAVLVKFESME